MYQNNYNVYYNMNLFYFISKVYPAIIKFNDVYIIQNLTCHLITFITMIQTYNIYLSFEFFI